MSSGIIFLSDDSKGLTIVVKPKFRPSTIVGGLFVVLWSWAVLSLLMALAYGKFSLFGLLVVVLFAVAEVAMVYFVLWNWAGREVLRVAAGRLTVEKRVIGIRVYRASWPANEVTGLGAGGYFGQVTQWTRIRALTGFLGKVRFDAQGRTRTFGTGIDEAAAHEIAKSIASRMRLKRPSEISPAEAAQRDFSGTNDQ